MQKKSEVKIPEKFLKKIAEVHLKASKIFNEFSPEAVALMDHKQANIKSDLKAKFKN